MFKPKRIYPENAAQLLLSLTVSCGYAPENALTVYGYRTQTCYNAIHDLRTKKLVKITKVGKTSFIKLLPAAFPVLFEMHPDLVSEYLGDIEASGLKRTKERKEKAYAQGMICACMDFSGIPVNGKLTCIARLTKEERLAQFRRKPQVENYCTSLLQQKRIPAINAPAFQAPEYYDAGQYLTMAKIRKMQLNSKVLFFAAQGLLFLPGSVNACYYYPLTKRINWEIEDTTLRFLKLRSGQWGERLSQNAILFLDHFSDLPLFFKDAELETDRTWKTQDHTVLLRSTWIGNGLYDKIILSDLQHFHLIAAHLRRSRKEVAEILVSESDRERRALIHRRNFYAAGITADGTHIYLLFLPQKEMIESILEELENGQQLRILCFPFQKSVYEDFFSHPELVDVVVMDDGVV